MNEISLDTDTDAVTQAAQRLLRAAAGRVPCPRCAI